MSRDYEKIDWKELSKLGLVERINREILHPLGYAVFYNCSGSSDGALVAPDGEWTYTEIK